MLPRETIMAMFPPSMRLDGKHGGKLAFYPFTLAHAAALEAYGCEPGTIFDRATALLAAWLLSLPPKALEAAIAMRGSEREAKAWMRKAAKVGADAIADAVNAHILGSFDTFVPVKNGGTVAFDDGLGHGYGWPLEVAEALCAGYGWSFEYAMATPVARALALVTVRRHRESVGGGPDYYDRIRIKRMKEASCDEKLGKKPKEDVRHGGE